MTLNEVSVPALGIEERSDEAPRAGRARPTPDGGETLRNFRPMRFRSRNTESPCS